MTFQNPVEPHYAIVFCYDRQNPYKKGISAYPYIFPVQTTHGHLGILWGLRLLDSFGRCVVGACSARHAGVFQCLLPLGRVCGFVCVVCLRYLMLRKLRHRAME